MGFSRKTVVALVAIGTGLVQAGSARAVAIGVFSTGDATPGSIDPHYLVVTSPDANYPGPAVYVTDELPGNYIANDANSSWICLDPNADKNFAPGTYDYRTTFDLTGLDPASATLTGEWSSDNGAVMELNGTATGNTLPDEPFGSLTPFTVTGGFVSGLNTLDFIVTNDEPDPTPTALRVDISGSASPVPEPTTLLLLPMVAVLAAKRTR